MYTATFTFARREFDDAFHALDAPTKRVEEQGVDVAKRVHLLDETPTVAHDRTPRRAR